MLQQTSDATAGFILRDDVGCPIIVYAQKIGKTNVHIAEVIALRDSLLKAHEMEFQDLIVEGDYALVINRIKGNFKCPWRLLQLVQNINSIAAFQSIVFYHVLREANVADNALANLGHQLSRPSYWESDFLLSVGLAVNFDLFGADCFQRSIL
ncbi:PREDICTED: uncharacterized protein LOC101314305 [Fragaria vesca subsp. vesca]|uniref:uncharacterized protein LOC101314305 n=1 Tax=Fragaria vesca subsp. vesca TaxID=101020 RepID=UPI0002C305D9|nr:PREDICTED: uncharacterized protein LOC101314305 [Fragaria vesca subsp. vesca]